MNLKVNYWRLFGTLLFILYFFSCAANQSFSHFIDNIDLIIHEAGHWIFIFFGQFMSIMGGSITQILIPVVFSAYFFLRREWFSAFLLMFWVGYNFINVSFYMADALFMRLPLLGGESSIHDWNFILSDLNLLRYTDILAKVTYSFGILLMITATVFCIKLSFSSKTEKAVPSLDFK